VLKTSIKSTIITLIMTISITPYARVGKISVEDQKNLETFVKKCEGCPYGLTETRDALAECVSTTDFTTRWYQDPIIIAGISFVSFGLGAVLSHLVYGDDR